MKNLSLDNFVVDNYVQRLINCLKDTSVETDEKFANVVREYYKYYEFFLHELDVY
ncbi:MAG: hypothetical protein PVJ67_02210 [Candidatus Pacearchaeota archaeon]|jgi:hypothetical protein